MKMVLCVALALIVALPALSSADKGTFIHFSGMTRGARVVYWDVDAKTGRRTQKAFSLSAASFGSQNPGNVLGISDSNKFKIINVHDGWSLISSSTEGTIYWQPYALLKRGEAVAVGGCAVEALVIIDEQGNFCTNTYMNSHAGVYRAYSPAGAGHMAITFSPDKKTAIVKVSDIKTYASGFQILTSAGSYPIPISTTYGDSTINMPAFKVDTTFSNYSV